jgi:hypothetical protein
MDPAKPAAIMDEWRTKEFWPLIEKYKIPLNCMYNADQTLTRQAFSIKSYPTQFMWTRSKSMSTKEPNR